MSPRLKASLLGLVCLVLAGLATFRGFYHLDKKQTTEGKYVWASLSFALAAFFAVGGLKYIVTGRPDAPAKTEQSPEPPPGGSP